MDNRCISIFLRKFFFIPNLLQQVRQTLYEVNTPNFVYFTWDRIRTFALTLGSWLQGFFSLRNSGFIWTGLSCGCRGMPVSLMVFLCRLSSLGVYELLDTRFSELQSGLLLEAVTAWFDITRTEVVFAVLRWLSTESHSCCFVAAVLRFLSFNPLVFFFPWGVMAGLRWKLKFERIRRWDIQHSAPLTDFVYSDIKDVGLSDYNVLNQVPVFSAMVHPFNLVFVW